MTVKEGEDTTIIVPVTIAAAAIVGRTGAVAALRAEGAGEAPSAVR